MPSCRLLTNVFIVIIINIEIDEFKLNGYLQFIMVLYQNYEEYFYHNDLKLLIQILVRQMQMNRSSNYFYINKNRFEPVFNYWRVECDGGEDLVGWGEAQEGGVDWGGERCEGVDE